MSHIPEPWEARPLHFGWGIVYPYDFGDSVPVTAWLFDTPIAEKYARLIAAAPELLAACYLGLELLDTLREDGIGSDLAPGVKDLYRGISEQMRDAIAKAKGDFSPAP